MEFPCDASVVNEKGKVWKPLPLNMDDLAKSGQFHGGRQNDVKISKMWWEN